MSTPPVTPLLRSINEGDVATWPEALRTLKRDVTAFAKGFPAVGFDASAMRYKD